MTHRRSDSKSRALARDDAAVEKIGEFFLGKVIPTDMPDVIAICHESSFESAAYVT